MRTTARKIDSEFASSQLETRSTPLSIGGSTSNISYFEVKKKTARRSLATGWLLAVDSIGLGLALVFSALVKWQNGAQGVFDLFSQSQPRLLVFCALIATGLAAFYKCGHYKNRKPFWQSFRDVIRILVSLAIRQRSAFTGINGAPPRRLKLHGTKATAGSPAPGLT